ncbi:MAG: TolC family protein [Saonia sp.]
MVDNDFYPRDPQKMFKKAEKKFAQALTKRLMPSNAILMMPRNTLILCTLMVFSYAGTAQERTSQKVTLLQVYTYAQQNYPLIQDTGLINELEKVNLEVIKRSALPKIDLNGLGQLQSENIQLDLGTQAIEGPLETYNAYLSAEYDLYDGGKKRAEKNIQRASSSVERKSLDVALRSLKDRVNTLLFALSLSKKQQRIFQTSKEDLDVDIETLRSGYDNGTVLESEVSKLMVRQLELTSDIIKLQGDINSYAAMLEQLTGKTFPADVQFEMPVMPKNFITDEITRPEQALFDSQKSLFAARETSIAASLRPKVALFAQGGIGNPNPLNFSDFDDSPYALGGVKLSWNFLDFGKGKKERELLRIQQEQIEVDRDIFLFDIQSQSKEYLAKIKALEEQIANDAAIVGLQQEILEQSKVQLDNGVINSSEYVTQINTAINAEQQLEFNRIQLQQFTIEYLTLIGQL